MEENDYLNSNKSLHINFQILISPLLIFWIRAFGLILSTVQPMDRHVPKTDFTVPVKFLARDFSSTVLAIFFTCSRVRLPLCVTFLTFFRSRSYPPSSLMMSADEVGWTEIYAARFWHLSWTITLIPFHFPPYFTISSPTFFAFYFRKNLRDQEDPIWGQELQQGLAPLQILWCELNYNQNTESDFGRINLWRHWMAIFILLF